MAVAGQTPTRVHLIDSETIKWEQIGASYPDPNDPTKLVRDVKAHEVEFLLYGDDTGAANAYAITLSPAATIVKGSVIAVKAANANTGASTLAIDGGTPIAITARGAALSGGEIPAGQIFVVIYDGTNLELIGVSKPGGTNHQTQINSSGAFAGVGPGTAGQYLRSGGASADPGFDSIAEFEVTGLVSDLALKAPLASPALTGTPTAPTAAAGTNTTQLATTAFVEGEVADGKGLVSSAGVTIDGGGSTPSTGSKGFLQVPFGCTITGWTLLADASGSAQITVKKCSDAGFPTTASIVASAPPNLSSAQKGESSTLTGWTTAISANDILEFNLDSVTTCKRLTLELKLTRS